MTNGTDREPTPDHGLPSWLHRELMAILYGCLAALAIIAVASASIAVLVMKHAAELTQ